ncbi:putative chondroadherin-like protein [Apostichopus japonicus]|uniref:Putative chondroadherin-like protein n=1 Tax=Stichopus japonicus TaxID=307972 RepID=A0A2G8KY46_STIJA|nr:putative chondroadherin-like protein [Apostichopus japonicus]
MDRTTANCRLGLRYLILFITIATVVSETTCPSRCTCTDDDVDCSDLELTEIPTDLPTTATSIDLSGNAITALNGSAFSDLSGLMTLDLTDNLILDIEDNAFGLLGNLEVLKLANNSLKVIKALTLSGLNNLQILQLSFNPDLEISEGALQVASTLVTLEMNGCGVDAGRYDFSDMRSLRSLELSYCDLHQIDPEKFKNLESLESLDLSDNKFQVFPCETITELRKLTVLNCRNNDIDLHEGKLLTEPSMLTVLHLDNNAINAIHEKTLHDMRQLQNLTLTNNGLRTLPETMFTGIPAIGKLSLSLAGNRLDCDCELRWMLSWIHENEIDDVRCVEPEQNKFHVLKMLEPEQLACPPYEIAGQHIYRALEGEDVTMGCPIFIDDYTTVHWSSDCGELVPIPSTFPFEYPYSINEDHALIIDSVTTDACDTYVCQAQTTAGSLTTELTLEVLEATNNLNGVIIALSVGMTVFALLVVVALVMLGLRHRRDRPEDRPTTGPYSNLTEPLTEMADE